MIQRFLVPMRYVDSQLALQPEPDSNMMSEASILQQLRPSLLADSIMSLVSVRAPRGSNRGLVSKRMPAQRARPAAERQVQSSAPSPLMRGRALERRVVVSRSSSRRCHRRQRTCRLLKSFSNHQTRPRRGTLDTVHGLKAKRHLA